MTTETAATDADLFSYRRYSQENRSVISRELAEKIADAFAAAGIDSPHATEPGAAVDGKYQSGPPSYTLRPEIMALVEGLPKYWTLDVSYIQHDRVMARIKAEQLASYEAVEHAGIRAYLIEHADERGMRKAELSDQSGLARLAIDTGMANGKPVYQPKEGCKAKLKLREAISFSYSQESYADHTQYAVPVDIPADADLKICRSNLSHFCQCLRTHNGFAGSGCTWTSCLIEHPEGPFVILECRASISD